MKFVKYFITALLILVVGLAVFSLLLPDKYSMSRSIIIKADNSTIYEFISKMKNIEKWNPWYELDTNIVYQFGGADLGTSSDVKWVSKNDIMANAYIRIDSIDTNKFIKMYFTFSNHGIFDLSFKIDRISETESQLSMEISKDIGFNLPYRYYALMYNYYLEADFDKALEKIKVLCQNKFTDKITQNAKKNNNMK